MSEYNGLDGKRYKSISTGYGDPSTDLVQSQANDFGQDSRGFGSDSLIGNKFDGVSSPDQGEKTDMDMALGPNMFPRQKGHDSLSEEEAVLS